MAINYLDIGLEPSWSHHFEKETPNGPMSVVLVHALVDQKLIDISFWYPTESAPSIEPEIHQIAASLKRH